MDAKTLAAALLSRRFSLQGLAEYLGTPAQKHATDEHGTISPEYLEYARADVQVTWECYRELKRRYEAHGLDKPMDRLLSEATIGKAYLEQMGVRPFLGCSPDFPRKRFGEILCAYYGGRAEVRIRREVREVLYCDFKSMYPTVNSLMGLWRYVTADSIEPVDTTAETRAFLQGVTLGELQQPDTWSKLNTLVRLHPDADVLPVRAKYDERTYTIGLNQLTAHDSLWFTLADCIVSKLLTGKRPAIDKAISYRPGPQQQGLQPIEIMGRPDYRIDPNSDDFFRRLIDMRDEAKANGDEIQQTLKIIANSTSYGIFMEINRDDAPKPESLNIVGPNGELAETDATAIEEPGRFFQSDIGRFDYRRRPINARRCRMPDVGLRIGLGVLRHGLDCNSSARRNFKVEISRSGAKSR